jgi:uncharacterized spore protein YtfJ
MDVDDFMTGLRERFSSKQVFGEPVERDGVTLITVATVRGGGGGGGDNEQHGGGGFGLATRPIGAYVIRDGDVEWKPVIDPARIMLGWQLVSGLAVVAGWRLLRGRRG